MNPSAPNSGSQSNNRNQYSTTTKNGGSIYYGTASSSSSSSSNTQPQSSAPYKKRPGIDRYESFPRYRGSNNSSVDERSLHKSLSSGNIGRDSVSDRRNNDYSKEKRPSGQPSSAGQGGFRDDRRHRSSYGDTRDSKIDRYYGGNQEDKYSPVSGRNELAKKNSASTEDSTKKSVNDNINTKDSSPITDPKLLHLFDDDLPDEPKENSVSVKEEIEKDDKNDTDKVESAHPVEKEIVEPKRDVEVDHAALDIQPETVSQDNIPHDIQSQAEEPKVTASVDTPKKTSLAAYLEHNNNKTKQRQEEGKENEETSTEEHKEVSIAEEDLLETESQKLIPPKDDEIKEIEKSSVVEESALAESVSSLATISKENDNKDDKEDEAKEAKDNQSVNEGTTETGDTSTLSPIKESASEVDFNFNTLASIPEVRESLLSNISEDEKGEVQLKIGEGEDEADEAESSSEAETIIADSPPRINRGRKLIRKKELDEVRHNLKRKAMYSSDEDEDDDFPLKHGYHNDDGSHKKRDLKPYKIKRDSGGRTLLQRSCKKGNLEEVRNYIQRGASANEKDFCGFTCLHEAALEGHTDVVQYLIEKGANVNAKADAAGDMETPLIDAAENKHFDVVKLLLDNGADPSIYNIDGFSALTKIQNEHSGEGAYSDIIKLLEEASAKFKLATKVEIIKASSPTPDPIVDDPNDNYFGELIKKKGIYKYAAEGSKEVTANYFVSGNSLSAKPDILILAARNGHAELVDIILGLNPTPYNIDTEGGCGITALLASVGRGHYDVVENLLSKDADPFKRRKQDKLNALQIAQRSAHFDPKEIKLIEEYMNKSNRGEVNSNVTSTAVSRAASPTHSLVYSAVTSTAASPNISESEEDDSFERESKATRVKSNDERKRKHPSDREQQSKKLKKSKLESKVKIQPSSVFKESSPEPLERVTTREQSSTPPPEKHKVRAMHMTASPSPTPLTKAQEELKAKKELETKIWQEKVEAKKRARRDMFLKQEKEKERQRKEEEEKRIEEEKKLAELQEKERVRLAKEAEEKSKILQVQRVELMRQITIENYPVGLRRAKFNVDSTIEDSKKYLPLYIFNINSVQYVTDLQISLLMGAPISKWNSKISNNSRVEATATDKSKLWRLFYEIIGIDPSLDVHPCAKSRTEGHKQFQNLLVHFVKFEDISKLVEEEYPTTHELVWKNFKQCSTEVVLESLRPFDEVSRYKHCVVKENEMDVVVDTKNISKFIPPHLGYRKDTIRTIGSHSRPLW